MKKIHYLVVLMTLTVVGCKNDTTIKPNMTGSMGEVMLVMNENVRTSEGGQYLNNMFRQEMQGLPQVEPLFKVSTISPTALSGHLKLFRNLLIVTVSSDVQTEGVKFFDVNNVWAKDQALMSIEAKNLESFKNLVENFEIRILGFFLSAERNRSLTYYTKNSNAGLMDQIRNTWGFSMVIPSSYKANKPKSGINFNWYSLETASTSEAVMIYAFDYIGEGSFSKEYLLYKRDSVLKANIPGSFDNSYMATETDYPITYKTLTVNGHRTVELRGLWKVVGDMMGGPFIMFAHFDEANNRVVVTDGYVFYPEKPEKRNYVVKVESLLYSVKFPKD